MVILFQLVSGSTRATIAALCVVAVLRTAIIQQAFVDIQTSVAVIRRGEPLHADASGALRTRDASMRAMTIVHARSVC